MMIKSMVGLAALLAGGFVAIDRVVVDHVKAASERISIVPQSYVAAPATYKALWERANSAVNTLLEREKAARVLEHEKATQRARADSAAGCRDQTWPYYSGDCVVAQNRATPRRQVRIVRIETGTLSAQAVSF